MHLVLVGVNHRSAPVELRERLAFRSEDLPEVFATLRQSLGLEEAAILSTCNRVEIYAGVSEVNGTVARLQQFLSDHGRMDLSGLSPRLYVYYEPKSIHHLFSVASGLDSMVLGEGEILQQVKSAYESARRHGATGKAFNGLFQRALNTAKAVRSQTGIGYGCTSIGAVAVELSQKIFSNLAPATVVLVGAGKIGEITLRRLADRGVRHVRVINRSLERAEHLAAHYQAQPLPFSALHAQLLEADIVITSTSAPETILSKTDVAQAMRARHQRPLCIVDLGVPRNVEPSVETLENVYLFNVDDLQGLVDHHHAQRLAASQEAQAIIDQKVSQFLSWWHQECRTPNGEWRIEKQEESVSDHPHSAFDTRHSKLPNIAGD